MLLLLPSLLLLGTPLGCAEGATATLTPERVPEWQGECLPGRRDQIRTSGLGWSRELAGDGGQLGRPSLHGGRTSAVLRKPGTPFSEPRTRSLGLASCRLPQRAGERRGGAWACGRLPSARARAAGPGSSGDGSDRELFIWEEHLLDQ